ncbi:MAG: hypothetical protein U9N33_04660 [Campylobacterota bacterium]|nr:hypothetical protein [Campylobacterota bacterium]
MIIFKIVLSLFLALFVSGCFGEVNPPKHINANEKAFEEEDTYILYALRAEQIKEYEVASSLFDELWKRSDKREYLYRSLQNDLSAQKNKKVIDRVDELIQGRLDDYRLARFKVVALISDGKLEEARVLAVELVEISNEVKDYLLVSEIYIKQKKYDTALKYLESAYTKNYNEIILDKMSIILYVNLQRTNEAIAQLETHTRVYGCSKIICSRLISFYSNENNLEGLLSTSLRIYELDRSDDTAKKIVQIYLYKKEYIKLLSFLEKSSIDDEMLLQMYVNLKNYKKASELSDKLYVQTGDLNYLGQSAIFEYESSDNKDDKKMQNSVVEKLKEVVKTDKNPLYLNYLGYLLIDHSLNIEDGMKYVQEALKFNQNSAFYLDSLAWGYYRLGNCKKAYEIIQRAMQLEGGDDPEVIKHVKAIESCKN